MSTERQQKLDKLMNLLGEDDYVLNNNFTVSDYLYPPHYTQAYDFQFNTVVRNKIIGMEEYVLTINPGINCKNTTKIYIYRDDYDVFLILNGNKCTDVKKVDGNLTAGEDIDIRKWIHRVHFVNTDDLTIASLFPGYNQYVFSMLLFKYLNVTDVDLKKCNNGTKYDLLTVYLKGSWLTDTPINNYFQMIQKRSKDGSVYAFSTDFWVSYESHGYCRAKRFVKNIDLFSFKKLYFPINVHANHWILICIDIRKKKTIYFDSLVASKNMNFQSISFKALQFLLFLYREKINTDPDFNSNWQTTDGESPLQDNADDCGVYVCVNGEFHSRDLPSTFRPNNSILLRQRIAFEILFGRLIFNEDGSSSIDYSHYDVNK